VSCGAKGFFVIINSVIINSVIINFVPIIRKEGNLLPNIEQKSLVVTEIRDKFLKAKSVVLLDSRGLTVDQDTSLRKKLREAGVDYKVYKNKMIELAAKDTAFEGLSPFLKGPSAVAVCYADETAATRAVSKELKSMPKLEFKAGIIEGAVYDADGIKVIAEIPPRAELLSKLLGSFKQPAAAFARLASALAEKSAEPAAAVAE
jgi:large subunit ribosomal protein L10